jgi:hypothetical protein
MKSRTLMWFTAVTLFGALAQPMQLAAKHTRYKLIDVGTLGGPASYLTDQVSGRGNWSLTIEGCLPEKRIRLFPIPMARTPIAVPSQAAFFLTLFSGNVVPSLISAHSRAVAPAMSAPSMREAGSPEARQMEKLTRSLEARSSMPFFGEMARSPTLERWAPDLRVPGPMFNRFPVQHGGVLNDGRDCATLACGIIVTRDQQEHVSAGVQIVTARR